VRVVRVLGQVDHRGGRVHGDGLVRVAAEELERAGVVVRRTVEGVDLEDVAVVALERGDGLHTAGDDDPERHRCGADPVW
jgi:hypothetical protein